MVTFVFACVCIELWPSGMTIWALVIALVVCKLWLYYVYNYLCLEADERLRLAVVYVIPIGMIQAITNRQIGLK